MNGVKAEIIAWMEYMFYGCNNLLYLNIYNLNTMHIISFLYIFEGIEEKFIIEYDKKKTDLNFQREIQKYIKE